MNPAAVHYDAECLERLLEDALPEPLLSDAADHIGRCAACREKLESLAGDRQWWSQACSGLKAILADPAAYRSSAGDQAQPESSAAATGDEGFAAEFAVDFLEPSDDPAILGRLGEYEILEIIGRGGMGIVLKGRQQALNRYVAVKVLAPHLAQSAAARKRFAREAQATAAVVHPHVMAIHAVAASARLPYLVMPFVACESLQERLDRHGPLELKDVLRIGLQAAHGLAAAHAQGLVHRDVKPANILLETSVDRVMLTDFGLARAVDDATLTRTGIIAGTPQFMSPEQAGGETIDHRSDLFSLGSVLYAMCTGRPPFRAETTFGVLRRIRETPPRPIREISPDIPAWLERIVLKLLSKAAADRIATAGQVAALLEQCLAHVQQPTAVGLPNSVGDWPLLPLPPDASKAGPPKSTRLSGRWIVAGLAAVTAVGLLAFFLRHKPTTTAEGPGDRAAAQGQSTEDEPLEWDAIQIQLDSTASAVDALSASTQNDLDDSEPAPSQPRAPASQPADTNRKDLR